ncbi:hypothetical protein C789_1198 [Microcystis aeruginosa FACHB-905 = DIANCHI905]|nr:hypothetical protein C789_1198 [Microcystis aeruginosa FACHB-905 = DIANCHI905]
MGRKKLTPAPCRPPPASCDIIRVCQILNQPLRIDAIEIWFFIFVKYGPTREDEPWKIKIC